LSHRILVVDDDDALREMVGLVLSQSGYSPVFAADGVSAVEIFREQNPDLVLLDIMLPGQSGIEVPESEPDSDLLPMTLQWCRLDRLPWIQKLLK